MTNKQQPLLPCPFCGGEAMKITNAMSEERIYCQVCGVTTDSYDPKFHNIDDYWNTRTPDQPDGWVIPIEVEDFIAKATALMEGLIPFEKRFPIIKLGNRLLEKYDTPKQ
jgi:Lar family restriction alleviation protein